MAEEWEKCVRLPENITFSKSNGTISASILFILHDNYDMASHIFDRLPFKYLFLKKVFLKQYPIENRAT